MSQPACRHPHGSGSNRAGFERMTSHPITPALFEFLRDLKASNERQWFEANKERYRTEVRDPVLDFIVALEKISVFRISSRSFELKLSLYPFSQGDPGSI